jgi:hypothetical protein
MRHRPAPWAGFAVIVGIILTSFVFCMVLNLPGHLSYDSVIQLLEGRTAQYANWHPAVMSWLLGLSDVVIPGTSIFVVFDALLFFGSLLGILLTSRRPHWASTPQFVIYPGRKFLFYSLVIGNEEIPSCQKR